MANFFSLVEIESKEQTIATSLGYQTIRRHLDDIRQTLESEFDAQAVETIFQHMRILIGGTAHIRARVDDLSAYPDVSKLVAFWEWFHVARWSDPRQVFDRFTTDVTDISQTGWYRALTDAMNERKRIKADLFGEPEIQPPDTLTPEQKADPSSKSDGVTPAPSSVASFNRSSNSGASGGE